MQNEKTQPLSGWIHPLTSEAKAIQPGQPGVRWAVLGHAQELSSSSDYGMRLVSCGSLATLQWHIGGALSGCCTLSFERGIWSAPNIETTAYVPNDASQWLGRHGPMPLPSKIPTTIDDARLFALAEGLKTWTGLGVEDYARWLSNCLRSGVVDFDRAEGKPRLALQHETPNALIAEGIVALTYCADAVPISLGGPDLAWAPQLNVYDPPPGSLRRHLLELLVNLGQRGADLDHALVRRAGESDDLDEIPSVVDLAIGYLGLSAATRAAVH